MAAGRARVRAVGAALAAGLVAGALATASVPAAAVEANARPALPTVLAQADDQLSAEELGLEAVAGFQGQSIRNAWMPVTVRLTPRRLFAGTIRVTTDRGITESREVEVAGAATKEFTFIVPSGSVNVQVQPQGDDRAVQLRPRVDGTPSGTLTGVSPTLLEAGDQGRALPTVDLIATSESVVWVTVDPLLLERSHLAVSTLGTLVLAVEDFDALGGEGLDNLEMAVLEGLNLVVVGRSGAIDTGLPWAPATAVAPGTGTTLTTVTPARDAWTLTAAQAGVGGILLAPASDDSTADGADGADDEATTVDPAACTDTTSCPVPQPTVPTTASATSQAATLLLAAQGAEDVIAASMPAGAGRVVVTGLSPAGGGIEASSEIWRHLVAERDASFRLNGQHTSERGWVAQEALRSGGVLDIPSLGLLAIFALGYVLVIGPGNALLVRKLGRRELGWVTVPAITVAFIGAAAIVASGTQPRVGVAGGAATWMDGLGNELVVAAVRAPTAGQHTIELHGPDWQMDPTTADFSGTGVTVDRASGDVVATMELQSLQVGTVIAHRPTDEVAPMDVTGTIDADGHWLVTVTNTSRRTLQDVQVRMAGVHSTLGDLPPGESFELPSEGGRGLNQLDVYRDVFQEARRPDGTVEAPRSFRALISGTALADRPGSVVVVADDPDAPWDVGGSNGAEIETLGRSVAVVVDIFGEGPVVPEEVDRALLAGSFVDAWQPSPHAVEGQLSAVLRFRLPGRAAGRVEAVVPDVARGEGFIEGRGLDIMPVPGIGGEVCVEVTDRFPDGSVSSSSSCGQFEQAVPACPEDAVSCDIGQDFWRFEFDDGRVQDGFITSNGGGFAAEPPRPFGNLGDALQIFDHAQGSWKVLTEVTGDDGSLPLAYVSPLGEVFVRAQGGLFPFDYSARGVGARLIGASA